MIRILDRSTTLCVQFVENNTYAPSRVESLPTPAVQEAGTDRLPLACYIQESRRRQNECHGLG